MDLGLNDRNFLLEVWNELAFLLNAYFQVLKDLVLAFFLGLESHLGVLDLLILLLKGQFLHCVGRFLDFQVPVTLLKLGFQW